MSELRFRYCCAYIFKNVPKPVIINFTVDHVHSTESILRIGTIEHKIHLFGVLQIVFNYFINEKTKQIKRNVECSRLRNERKKKKWHYKDINVTSVE